ncbi:Cytochrome b-c1 complex subunit 6, mitochondrial [Diplodia seriata]|uniref:Cytochrome b-c1 complex subunit 6, mitochondrial n=1 Tax=Diplodia seriata TaxID=420778 RepID=A0A0G2F126_9PEZI|nr:putative ubiquinol-cytochrome c reductase complex subunit [Diplodia seriata]OMP86206.1 Cytochrome b-c1 complex subunit 6 [Diplodia seriata]
MGITDFFSDLYSSVVIQDAVAEAPKADTGDEHQSGKNQGTYVSGSAQQRGARVGGGASAVATPATAGASRESPQEAEVNKADEKKGEDNKTEEEPAEEPEEEQEEEEEEEEEEEPEDVKEKIEAECAESKECHPAKHHYDECVERVTKQIDDNGKADEDCVEEFFHLAHCATACAAPKLWAQLK